MRYPYERLRLSAAENGWIVTVGGENGWAIEAEYVFPSMAAVCAWMREYLYDGLDEIRAAPPCGKVKK